MGPEAVIHQRDKNERVTQPSHFRHSTSTGQGVSRSKTRSGAGHTGKATREQTAAVPSTRLTTHYDPKGSYEGHRQGEGDAHLNTLQITMGRDLYDLELNRWKGMVK